MKRQCGSCTQCCKAMTVGDLEPVKPMHTWCKHCDLGKGCRIYPDRPTSCKVFECLWLQDTQNILGDDLRPDKTGCVIQPLINGGTIVHCDPARPTAWRNPKLLNLLRKLAAAGYPVSVEAKNRHWIITGTSDWEVPAECKEILDNGVVLIRCPDDIEEQIGLFIRPECRDLGPVLNPILTSKTL